MSDDIFFANKEFIKKEKSRARELRRSTWWKKKLEHGLCYYCEQYFLKSELTMEHKVPLSRGGRSIRSNLVVSCNVCNSQKKYRTSAEWVIEKEAKK